MTTLSSSLEEVVTPLLSLFIFLYVGSHDHGPIRFNVGSHDPGPIRFLNMESHFSVCDHMIQHDHLCVSNSITIKYSFYST